MAPELSRTARRSHEIEVSPAKIPYQQGKDVWPVERTGSRGGRDTDKPPRGGTLTSLEDVMSSGPNHRRGHGRIQGHGPTWENPNPEKGCNSTHVARGRSKWKKRHARRLRRTGRTDGPGGHVVQLPSIDPDAS